MAAKNAQADPDFMVIARVEALIAGWGLDEALRRAYAYRDAGADAILIHSKSKIPDEIFAFAQKWGNRSPLIVIPTTYYSVRVDQLEETHPHSCHLTPKGFQITGNLSSFEGALVLPLGNRLWTGDHKYGFSAWPWSFSFGNPYFPYYRTSFEFTPWSP